MNLPNLHLLISSIESEAIEGLGFNMAAAYEAGKDGNTYPDQTGHGCGTIACIGGWSYLLNRKIEAPKDNYISLEDMICAAEDFLEIPHEEAHRLTLPPRADDFLPYRKITWAETKATLLRLAKTGKVEWRPEAAAAFEKDPA